MKLLRKILGLCDHQWVIIKEVRVFESEHDDRPIGDKYILQCSHCGNIKTTATF